LTADRDRRFCSPQTCAMQFMLKHHE